MTNFWYVFFVNWFPPPSWNAASSLIHFIPIGKTCGVSENSREIPFAKSKLQIGHRQTNKEIEIYLWSYQTVSFAICST